MHFLVTVSLTLLALAFLLASLKIGPIARMAPLAVALPTLSLLLVQLWRDRREPLVVPTAIAQPWAPFAVLGGVVASIWLLGPTLTLPAFVGAALRLGARAGWIGVVAGAGTVLGLVQVIEWAGQPLPAGVLPLMLGVR